MDIVLRPHRQSSSHTARITSLKRYLREPNPFTDSNAREWSITHWTLSPLSLRQRLEFPLPTIPYAGCYRGAQGSETEKIYGKHLFHRVCCPSPKSRVSTMSLSTVISSDVRFVALVDALAIDDSMTNLSARVPPERIDTVLGMPRPGTGIVEPDPHATEDDDSRSATPSAPAAQHECPPRRVIRRCSSHPNMGMISHVP